MKICVIGTGYVGLVAGTCFAESGNDVVCVDIDEKKVARLKAGEVPIYEPGLEELIKRNTEEGRLQFTTDVVAAVQASLVCFIAVGTPQGEHDGAPDMRFVHQAARDVGKAMDGYRIVVTKSTVPVGTGERVRLELDKRGLTEVGYCANPEFLKEGVAIADFLDPDRVVVGDFRAEDGDRVAALYEPLGAPVLRTSVPTAEMIKYASNA